MSSRLLLLLCLFSASATVLLLTDDTIDKALKENEFLFIKFFAPWCGHCQHLGPIYLEAADLLRERKGKAVLAELDATTQIVSADKYNIDRYPTLILFNNGTEVEHYFGERTKESITDWLMAMAGQV